MYHQLKRPLLLFLSFCFIEASAQEEKLPAFIGVTGGLISYQGDLQPNSFSFAQSTAYIGLSFRKPVSGKFSIKAGIGTGQIKAADSNNREYLQVRNLSFQSRIKEAYLALDYALFNLQHYRFTPFASAGLVLFQFDPFTVDAAGNKVFLQPLGTEGQGLTAYPDRKKYKLTQMALGFSGGFRYQFNPFLAMNVEAVQRKTFTDYLDDVSKSYADRDLLLAGNGPVAAELAYRGDELSGASGYPKEGEQRGTPTEMDWYYYVGVTFEFNLKGLANVFTGSGIHSQDWYNKRCPPVY